jgi:hypothetical protein
MTMLCKKYNYFEIQSSETFKEGCGSKRAVLPMIMMMMMFTSLKAYRTISATTRCTHTHGAEARRNGAHTAHSKSEISFLWLMNDHPDVKIP